MGSPRIPGTRKIRNEVDIVDVENQQFRRNARELQAQREGSSRARRDAERLKRQRMQEEREYAMRPLFG